MIPLRLAFVCAVFACVVGSTRAHDPGLSVAQVQVRADTIELSTGFALADAQALVPPAQRMSDKWTAAEFEILKPKLVQLAPTLWEVRVGEKILQPSAVRVEHTEADSANFHLSFTRPDGAGPLVFRALQLDALPPGHRCYFTATDERGSLVERLLSAKNPSVAVELRPAATASESTGNEARPSAAGFVKLGVEHIWKGYDHLLFLFGLLIVCRTFKSIVRIITCFTLAHSLTLALATLDVVNLPSRFVEPMIAASIVFVGGRKSGAARRGAGGTLGAHVRLWTDPRLRLCERDEAGRGLGLMPALPRLSGRAVVKSFGFGLIGSADA